MNGSTGAHVTSGGADVRCQRMGWSRGAGWEPWNLQPWKAWNSPVQCPPNPGGEGFWHGPPRPCEDHTVELYLLSSTRPAYIGKDTSPHPHLPLPTPPNAH